MGIQVGGEGSGMFRLGRIATLSGGLFVTPMIAMADGLPQLDFANKLTSYQVVWGIVIFAILYVLARYTALPKVESVLQERAKRIAGDLEGAKDAKARADAGIRAAADATAKARAEAQAAINAALESSKQAAAAQSAVLNERLDKQLKEAEGQIAAARGAALAALPGVATDTAVALITRLTGAAPDPARLSGAINAAMAARGAGL
jgi:F-type H+-transporting ATPase subunit b